MPLIQILISILLITKNNWINSYQPVKIGHPTIEYSINQVKQISDYDNSGSNHIYKNNN